MTGGAEFKLLQEIRAEAASRVDTVANQLADGVPQTFEQYRESVGYLRAWRDILAFAEQQNAIFMRK